MTLVPNTQSACVSVPEKADQNPSSAILVQNGTCVESPYTFLSYLPTYTDSSTIAACRLMLFTGAGCVGSLTNLSISQGDTGVLSGTCNSMGGNSLKLACVSDYDATTGQSENAGENILEVRRSRADFPKLLTLIWIGCATFRQPPLPVLSPSLCLLPPPRLRLVHPARHA